MINNIDFITNLKKNDIKFFTGVPDSLFSGLCNTFQIKEKHNHIISTNEGSAIGLAIGYHLATKKIPLVYLQNSGIGNMLNPLVSLADQKIFNIPIFFLIGWRGEINKSKQIYDEPQHKTQGIITIKLLNLLKIKFKILNKNTNFKKEIKYLKNYALKNNRFVALLIKKNTFKKIKLINKDYNNLYLSREQALKEIYDAIPKNLPKVSTTGMLSRELNEINEIKKTENNTFMCVGGMGHAISIATGLALYKKKKIFCLDGDGSALMHLGSLVNSSKINNIVHILFNNFSHDSVGGQETPSKNISFFKLAKKLGYFFSYRVKSRLEIINSIKKSLKNKKSTFIEVLCKKGHKDNLGRPKRNPLYYKKLFMKFLTDVK